MLKVNRKVEYALIALKHMQQKPKGQLTTVREICEHYGTPFDPVAHVMRILNARQVVQSEQGAHGGYRLLEDTRRLSFASLIEMIEGKLAFVECARQERANCGIQDTCNIASPMNQLNLRMIEFLHSVMVGEIIDGRGSMMPELLSAGVQPNA
jgi:Rrf2 family protein